MFPKARSWNDVTRIATIQAIVEQHTLAIDRTRFADIGDKVFINGRFYSDKPPIPAFLGALVYWPIHAAGAELADGVNLAYYLVTLLTVKVLWIAGLYCFYRLVLLSGISLQGSLWLTLALAVGSVHLTWSSTFNNHSMAASSLAIAIYFFVRGTREDSLPYIFGSGFFMGFAAVCDIPTALFYPGFAVVLAGRGRLRQIPLFVAPAGLTILPYLGINWHIHHSILPVQIVRSYFDFPGSTWAGEGSRLSGVHAKGPFASALYGFRMLLGKRGFLLYNPLLIFTFAGAAAAMRKGEPFCQEARAIGGCSAIIFLYYAVMTVNYGGFSYSIRWFEPLLPPLFLLAYPLMDTVVPRRRLLFLSLFALSAAVAAIGLINPWTDFTQSSYPLVANIRKAIALFKAGSL